MDEYGLRTGDVEIGSAGPIAFGPNEVLFLADNLSVQRGRGDTGRAEHALRSVRPSQPNGRGVGSGSRNVSISLISLLGCGKTVP